MRERDIERYLVARVVALGGEVRKVQWAGHRGAPDRLVMVPGKTVWVELKAPGQKAAPHQQREHDRMRQMGQTVVVIDTRQQVDALFPVEHP